MVCKYCQLDYPEDHFTVCRRTSFKTYRRLRCKKCKVQLQSLRREKIREWLLDYKSKLCCKCGERDFRVLDFHHENGKDTNLGDVIRQGWSIKRIEAEIDKCTILCCKCHRIFHWEERNKI